MFCTDRVGFALCGVVVLRIFLLSERFPVIHGVHNLLEALRTGGAGLSRSARKVANIVLERPEAVIRMTLAELASEAAVSEPTVVRFFRAIGCDDYNDFKVALAQSITVDFTYADIDITPDDTAATYATKVFRATFDTLAKVHHNLDFQALDNAVNAIANAHRLEFYGLGASGAVAMDAYHKFFRLIHSCAVYTDSHMQYMAAATLASEDVVVAVSHTGRTKELLESVQLASRNGAMIVAITAPRSPLAEASSVLLSVDVPEDTDVHTPMMSRIAHLLIVDTLAIGVATKGGRTVAERLHRVKESLIAKRIPRVP